MVKLMKYLAFTFIYVHALRCFYVAARFSLRLTRSYYVKDDRTTRLSRSYCVLSVLTNTMTRAVLLAAGYNYQTEAFFQPNAKTYIVRSE